MGNFNMLCGASQQVIQEGDRCFLLPIIQQSAYSPISLTYNGKSLDVPGVSKHQCYPDSQWTWFGNFLEAKYTNRCDFELVNTQSNQVRMFSLAHRLMAKSATARQTKESNFPCFDFKCYVFDKHIELYKALEAAEPTYESEWQLIVPDNLAEYFTSLAEAFQYLYRGTLHSMVYSTASTQDEGLSAVQLAVFHGVVFDKLVTLGEAEKGTVREYFEEAQPKTGLPQKGSLTSKLQEAIHATLTTLGVGSPELLRMLDKEVLRTLYLLVGNIQQALYYAPHGNYGEYEEIAHGLALDKARWPNPELFFEIVRPVIEARFALNAMGREHLLISPLRTCGDEGNCYGEEYAKFIEEASAAVTLARPVRW